MAIGQAGAVAGLDGPASQSLAPEQLVRPQLLGVIYQQKEQIAALTAENTDLATRNTLLARENVALCARVDQLTVCNQEFRDANAGLGARVEQLVADNAALSAENADLGARLARCEHLLSRDSVNSSMPPSADAAVGRIPPPRVAPRRDGPRRRRGKQPGAPGTTLGWTDHPSQRVDLFPAGVCGCGRDLANAADEGIAASHQQHDIPPVEVIITQYDLHRVRCGCGKTHTTGWSEATTAGTPVGARNATVSWGPNTQAVCVFLLSEHHLPVRRVADVIHALAGRSPSTGFIHGLISRVAARIHQAGVLARIRGALGVAPAVCVDETPIRVGPAYPAGGGKAHAFLHVACTDSYTDYLVGARGLDTITATVIPTLGESVVLVHDRYSAYDSPVLGAHTHQLCTAHLLRNLASAAQAYPGQGWAQQISWSLRGLIHAANTARERGGDGIDPAVRDRWLRFFRSGVQIGLTNTGHADTDGGGVSPGQRSTRLLLETLRDRETDVLRFAHNLNVPATSNQAERDLRPAKLAQKISGRFTSLDCTKDRYCIRGYTSTAAKHGTTTFAALRQVIMGTPWMPPDPAPA